MIKLNCFLVLLAFSSGPLACRRDNTDGHSAAHQDTVVTSLSSDSQSTVVKRPTGPVRVIMDSSARGASIGVEANAPVVKLPKPLAVLLFESFPGFAPYSILAYEPTTVALAERDPATVVPSVVVGDFDGDGLADVAMIGIVRDSTAQVMLLTNANGSGPRLLLMDPMYPTLGSNKTSVILIPAHPQLVLKGVKVRKDAVEQVAVGQGAVVFYIDKGALRQIQTGD